jgi:hypothetical protein
LLIAKHFLAPIRERIERARGDLSGVALLHVHALDQVGVQETDVQGEHLGTFFAQINPQ